jgi:hypothetical protein
MTRMRIIRSSVANNALESTGNLPSNAKLSRNPYDVIANGIRGFSRPKQVNSQGSEIASPPPVLNSPLKRKRESSHATQSRESHASSRIGSPSPRIGIGRPERSI